MLSAVEDLVEISPREAIDLGAESLALFGKIFVPRAFRQESPGFHHEIGQALYNPDRYTAIEVFRGGAKTTLLRCFTLQRVSYAVSRTIMYVSVSQGHAILSIRWLKRQIETNTKLCQTFGLRKGSKWTDEVIEIYHEIEDTYITVLAMGITGQIRGFNIDDFRPDLIIADDVLNEENTATKPQREKISSLFFGALVNSLAPASEAPSAKLVLLQTPLDREDLIEACMQDPQWHGLRFGILDENGRSRWETRFPTEVVKAEKAAAIARRHYALWMREMECMIVAGEDTLFDTKRIQFWDVLPEGGWSLICIDPASSNSPDADENVVMCIYLHGPNVYVLDYFNGRGVMPDAAAAKLFEYIMQFRPRKGAVETISYQRVLKWYLEQEMMKRRIFLPIDPVQDRRSKPDRIIQSLSGLVHMGCLYIKPHMTELVEQLDRYDPDDSRALVDIIDCLALGVTAGNPALREISGDYEVLDDDDDFDYQGNDQKRISACP